MYECCVCVVGVLWYFRSEIRNGPVVCMSYLVTGSLDREATAATCSYVNCSVRMYMYNVRLT